MSESKGEAACNDAMASFFKERTISMMPKCSIDDFLGIGRKQRVKNQKQKPKQGTRPREFKQVVGFQNRYSACRQT
jgi:hypothetical protein